ncbi:unnamed protein product [Sphagnum troendelagicum]|uniref:Uncharacterized protein n=1 Tax=Sphagnum troendelagicum TaxID=128251 RepID=A0ABP0TZP1_9BRYO
MPGDQELHGSRLKITWASGNSRIFIRARTTNGHKRGGLAPSFVAAGVCVISADTSSSQLRHKVCTHARTRAFGFRRSLRAGSQGRRADWKMTAHDVREGIEEFCNVGWIQQSGTGIVGPNVAVIETCPVPTTEPDLRYAKWAPQELSLCTGTAHLVAL